MLKKYEVGQIYPEVKGHNEGCYFDISDEGANLIVYFDRPTQKEKDCFKAERRFEMRLLEMSDIMMFLVKFDSLNWMDAPYNPHLSKNLSGIQCEKGHGLAVTIMLFDTADGKLEAMRLVSLSEKITHGIQKAYEELIAKPFDRSNYYKCINLVFNRYSTCDLVKMSQTGFKTY